MTDSFMTPDNASHPYVMTLKRCSTGGSQNPLYDFFVEYTNFHGHIGAAICIFGILTNIANLIVLTRKEMRNSVNTLLSFLAFSNLMVLLLYLPIALGIFVLKARDNPLFSIKPEGPGRMHLLRVCSGLLIMFHFIAIWLIVAVAIFRLVVLQFPRVGTSSGYGITQQQTAYLVTTVIVIASCLVSTLNWLAHEVVIGGGTSCRTRYSDVDPRDDTGILRNCSLWGSDIGPGFTSANATTTLAGIDFVENITLPIDYENGTKATEWCEFKFHQKYYYSLSAFAKEHKWLRHVSRWTLGLTSKIIPTILLGLVTVCLVVTMSSAELRRRKLLRRPQDEQKRIGPTENQRTSMMLLSVVILFFLIEFPRGVFVIYGAVEPSFLRTHSYFMDFYNNIKNFAFGIMFFLFTAMSKKFRKTFYDVILKRVLCFRLRQKWGAQGRILIGNGSSLKTHSCSMSGAEESFISHTDNHRQSQITANHCL